MYYPCLFCEIFFASFVIPTIVYCLWKNIQFEVFHVYNWCWCKSIGLCLCKKNRYHTFIWEHFVSALVILYKFYAFFLSCLLKNKYKNQAHTINTATWLEWNLIMSTQIHDHLFWKGVSNRHIVAIVLFQQMSFQER